MVEEFWYFIEIDDYFKTW